MNTLLESLESAFPLAMEGTEAVTLSTGDVLVSPGTIPAYVVFPAGGIISLSTSVGSAPLDEVGVALLGCGDAVGLAPILGGVAPSHLAVVEVGAAAHRLPGALIRDLYEQPAARALLATYIAQMLERSYAETAASMRLAARARLARWLLQARSLLDSDRMGFSHDRISRLMGLRRPTVTVELHALEGDHLIRSTRGLVTIRDVDGLRAVASSSSAPDAPLLQIA